MLAEKPEHLGSVLVGLRKDYAPAPTGPIEALASTQLLANTWYFWWD